jgi:hypothetical protein
VPSLRLGLRCDRKSEDILLVATSFLEIGSMGSGRFSDLDLNLTKQVGTPLCPAPEMYANEDYTD